LLLWDQGLPKSDWLTGLVQSFDRELWSPEKSGSPFQRDRHGKEIIKDKTHALLAKATQFFVALLIVVISGG
jgi:hypothetical protein